MSITINAKICSTFVARLLREEEFKLFGSVIENPSPNLVPSPHIDQLPAKSEQANQGTALKYLDVTRMRDLYASAPSGQPGKAVMNMFVCAPRELRAGSHNGKTMSFFSVEVMERHPFTTQTFIPIGISATEASTSSYLVIVAPSLKPSTADETLPVPPSTVASGPLPGRGLPDLEELRAFIATGSQAVTYGAGTWHAPMVALGKKPIDFVVVQFSSSIALEDCQLVELDVEDCGQPLVAVPEGEPSKAAKL